MSSSTQLLCVRAHARVCVCQDILATIMMKTPANVDMNSVGQALLRIDGVIGVHDLHCFNVSDSLTVALAHLEVAHAEDQERVLISAQKVCHEHKLLHSTFQVETSASKLLLDCCCSAQPFDIHEVTRRRGSSAQAP